MRQTLFVFALLLAACSGDKDRPTVFDGGACGGSCGSGRMCVNNVCVTSPDAEVVVIDTGVRRDTGIDVPDVQMVDVGFDVGFDVIPDGCTATTAGNCCGVACPAVEGARPICGGGVCGFACNERFGDCDGNTANGCETATDTTDAHCGACGRACTMGQHCVGGTCACATGETLCDAMCVNTNANVAHCGGCGAPCAPGRACVSGSCVTCPTGQTVCGSACVTTATDLAHCGSCGNACPMPPVGATATCEAGVCRRSAIVCPAGTGNCDARDDNGCETTTTSSVMNCGAGGADSAGCGRACSSAGGTATCAGGACSIACSTGRGDCDADVTNGCEADFATSDSHCGMCARACADGTHCAAGVCAP